MDSKNKKVVTILIFVGLCVAIIGTIAFSNTNAEIYKKTTIQRTTADGVNVYLDIYEPAPGSKASHLFSDPRPAVIAVHGFGVSKEFLAMHAIEFARVGMVTICVELRSMGKSEGEFFNSGYQEWLENVDLDREMTEQFPDLTYLQYEMDLAFDVLSERSDIDMNSIALIGHSTGGGVVLKTALLHPDKIKVTVALSPLPIEGVNATTHKNFLLVLGRFDEAFSYDRELALFRQATGNSSAVENTMYGNFADGSARKFIYTKYDDHMSEPYNPVIINFDVNWIVSALKGQDTIVEGTVETHTTRMGQMIMAVVGWIIVIISVGALWLDVLKEKQNWDDKRKLVEVDDNLTNIPLWKSILTIMGINVALAPLTIGLFFAILAIGMTVASFIFPYLLTFGVSIMIYAKILSKKKIINGKEMLMKYCIPTGPEVIFGVVMGIAFLIVLQTFFGNNFVSMIFPIHKTVQTILLTIAAAVFLIANEFWTRLFIQNRWLNSELKYDHPGNIFKGTVFSTCISSFMIWTAQILGILIVLQIVYTKFIWMIVILILPILLLVNGLNAMWYTSAKRIPPVAMSTAIPITSALIAMSAYINIWL